MERIMTIENAIEIENHFISARKSLTAAYRNMKQIGGFESTCKEIADAALDSDNAARLMRQWIADNDG